MIKWEYYNICIDKISLNDSMELDRLGIAGWELCGVTPDSEINRAYLIFKRPLRAREVTEKELREMLG